MENGEEKGGGGVAIVLQHDAGYAALTGAAFWILSST